MPRSCSVCVSSDNAAITKSILAGDSVRNISSRFGPHPSVIQRHKVGCVGIKAKRKESIAHGEMVAGTLAGKEPAGTSRFESLAPQALIAGTARLVDEALELLEHAKKADDRRTALTALKEARDGLALLMKAAGMLASDNAVTINIDARQEAARRVAQLTTDEIRALAHATDNKTLSGSGVTTYEALPAPTEGTK